MVIGHVETLFIAGCLSYVMQYKISVTDVFLWLLHSSLLHSAHASADVCVCVVDKVTIVGTAT